MKRLGIFVAAALLLCVVSFDGRGLQALRGYAADMTYAFYVSGEVAPQTGTQTQTGLGTIVRCDIAEAGRVRRQLKRIDGESVSFLGTAADVDALLRRLDAAVVRTERVGDIDIVYAYSPYLRSGLRLDGTTVNVQLAHRNGVVSVGTPLLLGSY